jgi:hypothetical protein
VRVDEIHRLRAQCPSDVRPFAAKGVTAATLGPDRADVDAQPRTGQDDFFGDLGFECCYHHFEPTVEQPDGKVGDGTAAGPQGYRLVLPRR